MNDKLELFYRGLKDQKVSFIGLGRSHRELLPMFASKGARVSLRDKRTGSFWGKGIWKTCVRRT